MVSDPQHICMDPNPAPLRSRDPPVDQQDGVVIAKVLEFSLRHEVVETSRVAMAASKAVLEPMCRKDRAAAEAYYQRLHRKCIDMDSKLELSTSMDFAAQQAWTRYCKECINLLQLQMSLYGKAYSTALFTGRDSKHGLQQSKQQSCRIYDEHQAYYMHATYIVGRHRMIECTGQDIIDGFDMFATSFLEKVKSGQAVLEYCRLMSYCREMDKVVDDSWAHRPSKFKQWKEFCTTCHIALGYYCTFYGSQPVFIPKSLFIKDDNGAGQAENLALPTASLPQRPAEKTSSSDTSPITHVNDINLNSCKEGSSSSSSRPPNDITQSTPDSNYMCLVRDKLVFVTDESCLNLAGKDGKTWEPQPPNILVCQFQPEHKILYNLSCLLPDRKMTFEVIVAYAVDRHDKAYKKLTTMTRDKVRDIYEGYQEGLLTVDYDQLRCQLEIGIASAVETADRCKDQSISMLWLRQFLYGETFPLVLPQDLLPYIKPYLDNSRIRFVDS